MLQYEKRRVVKLQGFTHQRHRTAVREYGQGQGEVREIEQDKVWLVESGSNWHLVAFQESCRCDPMVSVSGIWYLGDDFLKKRSLYVNGRLLFF